MEIFNPNINKSFIFKLGLFHVFIIALSNYLITIPVLIFGLKLTYSAFSFPLIVVATDLTVRLINKQNARATIALAFIPAILASIAVIFLTGNPFSLALRVGIASGCSYLISNLLDVFVFQKVREKFKQWWAAPFGSSIIANYIDSFTFFFVAFANSANVFMKTNWPVMALNQANTKIVVGTLIVLPLYGLVLKYVSKKMGKDISGKVLK